MVATLTDGETRLPRSRMDGAAMPLDLSSASTSTLLENEAMLTMTKKTRCGST